MEKRLYRTSPREMIESVCQKGDIDNTMFSALTMMDGTLTHQRLQKLFGENSQKEVAISITKEYDDVSLFVMGRMDGLHNENGKKRIEEIKTVSFDPVEIKEVKEMHLLQALIYGYIYTQNENLSEIDITVTYAHYRSNKVKSFTTTYTKESLKETFDDVADTYVQWLRFVFSIEEEGKKSIKTLAFPFEYRKGQRKFMVTLYSAQKQKRNLFASAPTGTGKTISALFPSVKIYSESLANKIFYLTSKTSGKTTAVDTLKLLEKEGLKARSVVITAKQRACILEKSDCNPISCPRAKGHYDRIRQALKDILTNQVVIDRDVIEKYSEKHCVCPFEYSLDISLWTGIVIADYNYVYDPISNLKRFFSDGCPTEDFLLLVDEAHNLVARCRDMYSKKISAGEIEDILSQKGKSTLTKTLKQTMTKIKNILETMEESVKDSEALIFEGMDASLEKEMNDYIFFGENFLKKHRDHPMFDSLTDFYFKVKEFLKILELKSESHRFYYLKEDRSYHIFLTDPSEYIKKTSAKVRSTVFFSATLFPFSFYTYMLGGKKEDYVLLMESPFRKENLLKLCQGKISTKYSQRKQSLPMLCEVMDGFIKSRKANKMIFFPSYDYMETALAYYTQHYESENIIVQQRSMSEKDVNEFLSLFERDSATVAFVTLAGHFSEGIDLQGERLSMAMVVSVGMPKISVTNELIKDYFAQIGFDGFSYSYVYPGLNKVFQALGRVIRSEQDKGVVMIVDERFSQNKYMAEFPNYLMPFINVTSKDEILSKIEGFYNE